MTTAKTRRYLVQVVWSLSAGERGVFEYDIRRQARLSEVTAPGVMARMDVDPDSLTWERIGSLTSPACTPEQAQALALTWLTMVEGADPEDIGFEWLVTEVQRDGPSMSASMEPLHYSRERVRHP